MKTGVLAIMTVLLSLLLYMNVRQAYLYQEELARIEDLEEEQQTKYEENRRVRTGIAILESPQRLDALAQDELELNKARPDQTVLILPKGSVE